MNLLPLALLFLAGSRRSGGGGVTWPTVPPVPPAPPWTPPTTTPPTSAPPTSAPPTSAPPGAEPPVTDEQPPARSARYGVVRRGEGPYQFVARCCGQQYAGRWKHLLDVNPSIRLNAKKDNVTNASWKPGQTVRIPDDWPGGETMVSGLDTV